MSERIQVRAGDSGRVWVFAVDLDPDQLDSFKRRNGSWPLREALGAEVLDPDDVEVFPVSDLQGLGLSSYLEQGHGIAAADLEGLRERLDAQKGAVMVLTSRALRDREQTLSPRAPLRLLASLSEERAPVSFEPLPSEAATGTVASATAAPAPRGGQGRLGALILVAVVILAVLAVVVAI